MAFFTPKREEFDYETERTCSHCKHRFKGRFCSHCGQKVIEKEDFGLIQYISGLLGAYTSFDGKFWNSLRTLLRFPGKITYDLNRGITMPYMKPITFFFLANFIYFLLPYNYTFNSSLESQLTQMPYSKVAKELVKDKMISKNVTEAELTIAYEDTSYSLAKLLLFLLVILLLPFIYLVSFRSGQGFAEYFHFSLELSAFIILVPLVGVSLLRDGMAWISVSFGFIWDGRIGDGPYSSFLSLIILVFLVYAFRKAMGFSWIQSVWKASVITFSLIFVLTAFRFILFLATLSSI